MKKLIPDNFFDDGELSEDNPIWQQKISKVEDNWKEEYFKCLESPAYFYNNYFTINGELPKRKVTDQEIRNIERLNKLPKRKL